MNLFTILESGFLFESFFLSSFLRVFTIIVVVPCLKPSFLLLTLAFVSFVSLGTSLTSSFNTFMISYISIKMGDSPIRLARDSESNVSLVTRTRVSPGSNPSNFIYDRIGPEVISLNDNFNS